MNDTEQLIKEALNRQAERAPHPGPTLNALRRPARKRRRSMFLTLAVAAAAVAVLFTAGVVASNYQPPGQQDAAAAFMRSLTDSPASPMKYGLGWVPSGFVEAYRAASDHSGTVRIWVNSPYSDATSSEQPMVTLTVGGPAEWFPKGDVVESAVGAAYYYTFGATGVITRETPDRLRVTVRGVPDLRETAIKIADSVRLDDQAVVRSAVEYKGISTPRVFGESPTKWTSEVNVDGVTVRVSAHPPDLTGGKSVTVRGKRGTVVPGQLAVFDHGVWLTVTGKRTEGELIRAAADVKIDPKPDYAWLGR